MWRAWIIGLAIVAMDGTHRLTAADSSPVEKYLHTGQLTLGEKDLLAELARKPRDDQARFGLGILQFVRAVEHLGQSLYRYGLRSDRGQRMNLPFLRLPIPTNPRPEALTYAAARHILLDLLADLQKGESTLAAIQDEHVKLPLRLGPMRLDFAGGGQADDRFIILLSRYLGDRNISKENDLLIVFDRGDVAWLRGYCHLLMALSEIALAHDGQELFDCTAHLFFAKAETPHKFLTETRSGPRIFDVGDGVDVVDLIALIHLVRMRVQEPARMKAALGHLEQMLALSRESWKFILAETDNDHEWIPNPRQTGVLGVPVRQDMIDGWLEFIAEAEALLAGKRLIPFWRGDATRGVNLRRIFTEPRPFDLVLWVQGTGATPFLEKGTLTKPAVWARLQRVFGGEFIGFALWFN
jgi:hypothetical protein